MKKNSIYVWGTVYSLALLVTMILSVTTLSLALRKVVLEYSVPTVRYIYVKSEQSADAPTEQLPDEGGWIVREHEGRIGIFYRNGELVTVIDTYVKTLPEADRRMLEEGFEIHSQAEMNSIIEDYSD